MINVEEEDTASVLLAMHLDMCLLKLEGTLDSALVLMLEEVWKSKNVRVVMGKEVLDVVDVMALAECITMRNLALLDF